MIGIDHKFNNLSMMMNSNIMDWVAMIRIDAWYVDRIIGYILCNVLSRIFHKDFNIKGRI